MRDSIHRIARLAALCGLVVAFVGCSKTLRVCSVTPVDIEELKADSRDLDDDVADIRERLAAAEADLATWQGRLADRRAQPPALRAELARLKQASGRVWEEADQGSTVRRETDPTELVPIRRSGGGGE